MAPEHREGKRVPEIPQSLRTYTRWMDDVIRIPGTSLRFGVDSLIGLIPGVGDLAGGAFSLWTLATSARLGASAPVLFRMAVNLGIDAVLGSAPLLGDLFDVGWKANRRNLDLLEAHLAAPGPTRRASAGVLVAVVAFVVLALAAAAAATLFLLRWLVGLVG